MSEAKIDTCQYAENKLTNVDGDICMATCQWVAKNKVPFYMDFMSVSNGQHVGPGECDGCSVHEDSNAIEVGDFVYFNGVVKKVFKVVDHGGYADDPIIHCETQDGVKDWHRSHYLTKATRSYAWTTEGDRHV